MKQRLRIAFVDDEPNILTSLRRSMLSMLDEWEMTFFKSGAELLDRMTTEGFDIVVSDMRMPEMDGAALLNEVSRRSQQEHQSQADPKGDDPAIERLQPEPACDPRELRP